MGGYAKGINMASSSKVAEYLRLNGKYLKEAEELLTKNEFAQASKKLWGATAEIIKAVASKRGLELGTHRSLGEFVTKLHKERPDWGLIVSFNYANSLHTNFYEDHLPEEHVKTGAELIKDFVAKLKRLL